MATENVSFQDALSIVKNKLVNKSSTFSDIVSKPKVNSVRESSSSSFSVSNETFPNLSQSYESIKKSNNNYDNFANKRKHRTFFEHINPPAQNNIEYSSPNGTFLKYMSENTYAHPVEKSWISSLAKQLSQTLISTPKYLTSPSSLNKLIESHVINFLCSTQNTTHEQ